MDSIQILEIGIGGFTLGRLLSTLVLTLAFLVVIKVLLRLTDGLFRRLKVPATLLGILRAAVKVLLYFLLVITVMSHLGIPVTSLIAAMSVIGVALSLGVQNFLTNVVGGLQMLVSRPFEVGDFVDAGGCSGTVREIGLFYTKITTGDNKLIQLPNSSVVAANIINHSAEEKRRVDLTAQASYDAPVEQVERVLLAMLSAHPRVLSEPKPFARVSGYGTSAVEYTLRAWCLTGDYWDVYYDLIRGIKDAFDANGIEMTYDHVNVHMTQK